MIYIAESPNFYFLFNHKNAGNTPLPLIFNESGGFEWELNSYITKIGGGANSYGTKPSLATVHGCATALNVFVRFLDDHNRTLLEVDDEFLFSYAKELRNGKKANNTTVRRSIRRVLLALEHSQTENPFYNLLTTDFSLHCFQIHATENFYRRNRQTAVRYLSHACIDELKPAPIKPISFIRSTEIKAWHEAINEFTNNPYVKERWYIFSTLLEFTGSRISEVLAIPASAITSAYKALTPSDAEGRVHSIPVLKGKYKGSFRNILISRSELQELYLFIHNNNQAYRGSEIYDSIFLNSKTGKPLTRSTFNSYYRKVTNASKHSEILKNTSHHNFRHRYFTILVARTIAAQPKGSSTSPLEVAMNVSIKNSLHADKNSLSTYVHLSEDPDIQKAIKSIASSKLQKINDIRQSYKEGDSKSSLLDSILQVLDA